MGLRTGRFNISGAVTGNLSSGDPEAVAALDAVANACEASVSIDGVPAHCTEQSNSPVVLSASGEEVIIEFDIDCREPAAPDPMPEQPADVPTGGPPNPQQHTHPRGPANAGPLPNSGTLRNGASPLRAPPRRRRRRLPAHRRPGRGRNPGPASVHGFLERIPPVWEQLPAKSGPPSPTRRGLRDMPPRGDGLRVASRLSCPYGAR